MRFLGILCLVFTLLALGAVERTAYASRAPAPGTVAASLTQPSAQQIDGYGSRRGAHAGHVATHKGLPDGDMSSMLCKILCALSVPQAPLAVPDGFDSWLRIGETIVAAGSIAADEVTPGLHLPPPR